MIINPLLIIHTHCCISMYTYVVRVFNIDCSMISKLGGLYRICCGSCLATKTFKGPHLKA